MRASTARLNDQNSSRLEAARTDNVKVVQHGESLLRQPLPECPEWMFQRRREIAADSRFPAIIMAAASVASYGVGREMPVRHALVTRR